MARINYYWRLLATGVSFSVFGLGALVITVTLFPAVHLFSTDRQRAHRGCQYVVHLSFRAFIWMMKTLGILTYEFSDIEKLPISSGRLIIANHPTLLDVVFIISRLPTTQCVVKKAAWSNPFLAGVMWATGYIQNEDPVVLIDDCVRTLEEGNNLVIFPEATRTVPGRNIKLKRGAASVISTSRRLFTPLIMTCEPSTLAKGQKWFEIPHRRIHFKISVGEPVDPVPLLTDGEQLSKSNRRINNAIEELFVTGIERHGRSN
ncbi:MAG: 1-acyl-sn-glycerol-3-phosphate acyltransferase [Paracoccaceae bacterium]|jgi:1-acyl-sn-glycerol-3-phosphate acyltransferase